MLRKGYLVLIFLLVPLFISSAPAGEHHSSGFMDFLGKSINFIVLFGGLAFLLAKPLRNFLESRTSEIKKAMQEAEESRRKAEEKYKEIQSRLERLEEEAVQIVRRGEGEGMEEKARIAELARKEVERIRALTQQEIEILTKTGIRELTQMTADLAVRLAAEGIQKKLTPEIHSQLIDRSIERLARFHEKSNFN